MSFPIDRCIFNASSTGTGSFVVNNAVTGYLTPAQANAVNAHVYNYAAQIVDGSGNITAWEVGTGTYTTASVTLTRTPIFSSNSNAAVSFTSIPQVMIAALARDLQPNIIDKGTVGTGTVTFDLSASIKQKLTLSGDLTIAYSNWPASGIYGEIELQLINAGVHITWPTTNWLIGDGTTSTTFANMGVTLATSGTNTVITWSIDGGTTLYGKAA